MSSVAFCAAASLFAFAATSALATDGRTWKTPVFAEDGAGDALIPQIGFDAHAQARAVWVQSDGMRRRIVSNDYSSTTGWNTAAPIDAGSGDSATPQIAVGPASDALAVWVQPDGDHDRIRARPYLMAGGWGLIQTLDIGTGGASGVQVAIDSQTNGLAIWNQSDGARKRVWWARYTTGPGWVTAPAPLDPDDIPDLGDAQSPQIAFDVSGNALAVWQQFDGTRNRIFSRRYSGGTWADVRSIDATGVNAGDASAPQVAFDRSGIALAVWVQFDSDRGHNRIFSNRWIAGNWTGAAAIDSPLNGVEDASTPQIAFDTAGNAGAVWSQSDGTRFDIWANRATPAGGWGVAAPIENQEGDALAPAIAFDAAGNAVATWNQFNGSRFSVRANIYDKVSGSWGTARPIESDEAGGAFKPRAAFDVNGVAVVIWYQSDGTRLNIKSARYDVSQWGLPTLIETNPGNAYGAQVAVDPNGNGVVVWTQLNAANSANTIWTNRYTVGSGWGAAEMLQTTAGNGSSSAVAADRDGNALAVWSQWDATAGSVIWSRPYARGSGWGAAGQISTGSSDSPQIGFDANGDAQAAWRQWVNVSGFGTYGTVSNQYIAGSGWGTASVRGGAYTSAPQLALDANGNTIIVWSQGLLGPNTVWSARYAAGQGWGSPLQLQTQGSGGRAQIAFDAAGNALAIWEQSPGWCGFVWDPCGDTTTHLWWARYTPSSGWSTPLQLQFGNQSSRESLAVDAAGNAFAAWDESDGAHTSIWTRRYTVGSGWGAPVLISVQGGPSLVLGDVQLAFDTSGNAVAVWSQSDGTRFSIWANRYTIAGGWGAPLLIEHDDMADATSPRLAIDGSGSVLAIWQQSDGTRNNIWANRFE